MILKYFDCWSNETETFSVLIKWYSYKSVLVKWSCNILVVDQMKWQYLVCWSSETAKFTVLIKWYSYKMCWSSEMKFVDQVKQTENVLIKWYKNCWSSDTPGCWSSDTPQCWSSEIFPSKVLLPWQILFLSGSSQGYCFSFFFLAAINFGTPKRITMVPSLIH